LLLLSLPERVPAASSAVGIGEVSGVDEVEESERAASVEESKSGVGGGTTALVGNSSRCFLQNIQVPGNPGRREYQYI
jgi:hypothetical protein